MGLSFRIHRAASRVGVNIRPCEAHPFPSYHLLAIVESPLRIPPQAFSLFTWSRIDITIICTRIKPEYLLQVVRLCLSSNLNCYASHRLLGLGPYLPLYFLCVTSFLPLSLFHTKHTDYCSVMLIVRRLLPQRHRVTSFCITGITLLS